MLQIIFNNIVLNFHKYVGHILINENGECTTSICIFFKFAHLFTHSIHLNFEMNSTHYKKVIIVSLSGRIFDYSW